MKFKNIAGLFVFLYLCSVAGYAEELYLASGAGYKRMVNDLRALYKKKAHTNINAVYGNMQQIIAQAKQSNKIRILIGDKRFLNKSGISFSMIQELGQGSLLLAYKKGLHINSINDICGPSVKKIMLPDPKKAIYGKAAVEHLKYYKLYKQTETKLLIVKTVPQVSAYLISGEADVGFINYSDYSAIAQKLGGSITVDKNSYSKIIISAAVIDKPSKEVEQFLLFLKTQDAKAILKKYGVTQ